MKTHKQFDKLAEQCYVKTGSVQTDHFDYVKFAELIVRECAKVANENVGAFTPGCGNSVLEHFGVEVEATRQALAQPEQEPICAHGVCKTKCDFCKQPEQEPVGTYGQVAERMYELMRGTVQQMEVYDHFKNILLYTAPPKREWVSATHVEIGNLWAQHKEMYGFAMALDNLLKEKNT